MVRDRIKYSGLIVFILIVIAFIIDFISTMGSFQALQDLTGAQKSLGLIMVSFEVFMCILMVVNSIIGIVKLVNGDDAQAAFRRSADGVSTFSLYVAASSGFGLYIASLYAKAQNLQFNIPIPYIAMFVLVVVSIILAFLASMKKLPIKFSIKCVFNIIASVLSAVVSIIMITMAQGSVLAIIVFAMIILALLINVVFSFFCLEENKNNN